MLGAGRILIAVGGAPSLLWHRVIGAIRLIAVCAAAALVTTPVRAQETTPLPASSDVGEGRVSLRVAGGIGLGKVGFAGRGAVETLLWPSVHFGFGLQVSALAQFQILGDRSSAWGGGPSFAIRWPVAGGAWELISAAGAAHLAHIYVDPCLLYCPGEVEKRRASLVFQGTLGVSFIAGTRHAALYGLGLRTDLLAPTQLEGLQPEFAVTLNVLVGAFWAGQH
jgi:hypothetical protein